MPEYYDNCISDDTIHHLYINRQDLIHSLRSEILRLRCELDYYRSLVRQFELMFKKDVEVLNE